MYLSDILLLSVVRVTLLDSLQENRHKVKHFHFLWNCAESWSLFHKLWNSSSISWTAPFKSSMLFQDVEQFATFNCVSHPSGSYYKLLFQNLKCSIWPSVPQFAELRPAYRACSTFREAVPHFWDAAPQKRSCFIKSGAVPLCVFFLDTAHYCTLPLLQLISVHSIVSVFCQSGGWWLTAKQF